MLSTLQWMGGVPLADTFLQAQRELARVPADGASDRAALEAALHRVVAHARAQWPTLTVADADFAAWLGERAACADALNTLDAPALYLTLAVAQGVRGAINAFHAAHGGDIDLALRRVGLPPDATDDARQVVLSKLLSPAHDKLRDYGGRGPLSHWVRAVAVRQAISLSRRRGPLERVVGEPSDNAPEAGHDPELAFLKAHFREAFKRVFGAAIATLETTDRKLLRLRFVDGLTLDQLARVRAVHRATVARHLARLRCVLVEAVRTRLGAGATGRDSELDGVLGLVESNLELSLPRLLQDPSKKPP